MENRVRLVYFQANGIRDPRIAKSAISIDLQIYTKNIQNLVRLEHFRSNRKVDPKIAKSFIPMDLHKCISKTYKIKSVSNIFEQIVSGTPK